MGEEDVPQRRVVAALGQRRPVRHLQVDLEAGRLQVFRGHQRHLVVELILLAGQDPDRLAGIAGLLHQLLRLFRIALVVGVDPGVAAPREAFRIHGAVDGEELRLAEGGQHHVALAQRRLHRLAQFQLGQRPLLRVQHHDRVAVNSPCRCCVESNGILVNVTSDAAPEAYPGWGAYGSSKAALEALSRVLAVEEEAVTVWQVDPGDLRTQMHQDAYPGEDISDRALPSAVAPGLLKLLAERPPSGRYRLPEWA